MPANHKLVCARAARFEFGEAYQRGISDFRHSRLVSAVTWRHLWEHLPDCHIRTNIFNYLYDEGVAALAWDGAVTLANGGSDKYDRPFRIMARIRPLLSAERDNGDYECMSAEGSNNSVVVHDGRVHRDGRTLYMNHSRFCLDRIFDERTTNDDIYESAGRHLLHAASNGGRSTLLLFGQTGTGNTYTAWGVMEHLAEEIFSAVRTMSGSCDGKAENKTIDSISAFCYEIAGTRGGREAVFDLLAERKPVKCLTGEDGQVHVRGAKEARCRDAAELVKALRVALEMRSSECTERNKESSRSHAIIEIQLPIEDNRVPADNEKTIEIPNDSEDAEEVAQEAKGGGDSTLRGGVLRIVDLAGSERNFETRMHTRQMAERGGHINYSVLMLKECARIMHRNRQRRQVGANANKFEHIPFRRSKLTHLLQSCFTDEAHRTAVVATLSPAPTDCEHTLNSLQHVGMMRAERASRAMEATAKETRESSTSASLDSQAQPEGFSKVDGRGHGLHSKLQDARQEQMNLHAFGMVTQVGGTIMRRYEQENMKTEAFIDPRYHKEMYVTVDEDLWVLKDADAEAVQILNGWRQEQWAARHTHDIPRWSAEAVKSFVASLDLTGSVRIPSTMTGAQLCRLGRQRLRSLCVDEATFTVLEASLAEEREAAREAGHSHAERNAKITGLGAHKVHVALENSTRGGA